MKLLEENRREMLKYTGIGEDLLYMLKGTRAKSKNRQMELHQTASPLHSKRNNQQMAEMTYRLAENIFKP
jgi:hypothetical protein